MPTKTWRGPAGGNWSNGANWLPAGVPASTDDVIFDATSLSCNLDVNGTCLSFDANTYGAKTFALNTNNITVATGIFRLGTGMTVTGTGTLIRTSGTGTNTMTSNGVIWTGSIRFSSNPVGGYAWGDNWTIQGNLTVDSNVTISGAFTISVGGSLTTVNSFNGSGTATTYVLNGTGTLNGTFTGINLTINTSALNTITLTTFLLIGSGCTFTYTFGNVIVNSGHSLIVANLSTIDTDRASTGGSKINFLNCSSLNSGTVTLLSNLTITNNFTNNNNIIFNGLFTIFIGGNISGATGTLVSTTSTIELNTATSSSIQQSQILHSLTINKSGVATVTLNSFTWGGANRILQRTAGNINPSTSTITIQNATVTISNMIFNNLTLTGGASTTITQNVLNTINGILQLNGTSIFTGTAGWTCASLVITAAGAFTITLQNGVTYTTTTAVQLTGATNTARYTMISNSTSARAIWTVGNTATQVITYVNGTRIDSSAGATVWTLGTVDTTVTIPPTATRNWNNGSQPSTVGYTFVN